jgi:hypothetical protein
MITQRRFRGSKSEEKDDSHKASTFTTSPVHKQGRAAKFHRNSSFYNMGGNRINPAGYIANNNNNDNSNSWKEAHGVTAPPGAFQPPSSFGSRFARMSSRMQQSFGGLWGGDGGNEHVHTYQHDDLGANAHPHIETGNKKYTEEGNGASFHRGGNPGRLGGFGFRFAGNGAVAGGGDGDSSKTSARDERVVSPRLAAATAPSPQCFQPPPGPLTRRWSRRLSNLDV